MRNLERIEAAIESASRKPYSEAVKEFAVLVHDEWPTLIAAARSLSEILELIGRDEETWVVEEYQDIIDRARAALSAAAESEEG